MDIALDILATTICNVWTWSVFYLAIALLVLSNNKSVTSALVVCVLGVVLSLRYLLPVPEVAFAMFIVLVIRSRRVSIGMLLWLATIIWAQQYVGIIDLDDIFTSVLLRMAVGIVTYLAYYFLSARISPHGKYISTHYTSTGYAVSDLDMCLSITALTYIYILLKTVMMII